MTYDEVVEKTASRRFPDAVNSYKKLGYELDIFIPSRRIAIEYDGAYFHKRRNEKDNEKDQKCLRDGITLFRFRAATLPKTEIASIITIEESYEGVVSGIRMLFDALNEEIPTIDLERDFNSILTLFEDRTGTSIVNSDVFPEWDYEKNQIVPQYIMSTDCSIKCCWKCLNGHESYWSYPYNRIVRHTGCPKCGLKKTLRQGRKE